MTTNDEKLKKLREDIREGLDQLDRGEGGDGEEAFERLRRRRANKQTSAENTASYAEAAADPEFRAEMDTLTQEFDVTVADGLEENSED